MDTFIYSAYVPSLGKRIKITELCFNTYKQLVKLVTSNDNTSIVAFFDSLINKTTGLQPESLTFLDKLIILLTIRSVCVADELELTVKHPVTKNDTNTTIRLYNVIEKVEKINMNFETFQDIKVYNDILEVTFCPPSELYFDITHDSLFSVIKKAKIKNQEIPLDKEQILNSFPITVFKDAKKYLNNIEEQINNTTLLSINFPSLDEENNIEMPLTLFQNSALEFLKLCFKKDLLSLYELEYVLTAKLNVPYELVKSSTYAENMLYIAFYEKEKKEQEKERQKVAQGIPLR